MCAKRDCLIQGNFHVYQVYLNPLNTCYYSCKEFCICQAIHLVFDEIEFNKVYMSCILYTIDLFLCYLPYNDELDKFNVDPVYTQRRVLQVFEHLQGSTIVLCNEIRNPVFSL